ncbi:MAG: hypothetical protein WKF43_12525 [Acidimicrobiales bacterium]
MAGRLRLAGDDPSGDDRSGGDRSGGHRSGGGRFIADDPTQASLVTGRSVRPGPIPVPPPDTLGRRPVRFKREAFFGFGVGAEVLVLGSGRSTTEIAVASTEVDAVERRLRPHD